MKTVRKLLIVLIALVLGFSLLQLKVVRAVAAHYTILEELENIDLAHGVHYLQTKANTTFIADDGTETVRNQVVSRLNVPQNGRVQLVPWALIEDGSWRLATIRNLANNYEATHPGKKVIAAINGDFFDIRATREYPYVPIGMHIGEGDVIKSEGGDWTNVIMTNIPNRPLIYNRTSEVQYGNYYVSVFDNNGTLIYELPVTALNDPTAAGTVVFFALWEKNELGMRVRKDFLADGGYRITNAKTVPQDATHFYGRGQSTGVKITGDILVPGSDFSIKTDDATLLTYLQSDQYYIRVQRDVKVLDRVTNEYITPLGSIGSNEMIVDNGVIVAGDQNLHPRTVIGHKANGDIVMTVIDGRQSAIGRDGCTTIEAAEILKSEGVVNAWNLDGGGSSTLLIAEDGDFRVVNSPSDGRERSDANGVLVVVDVPEMEFTVNYMEAQADRVVVDYVINDANGFDISKLYYQARSGDVTFNALLLEPQLDSETGKWHGQLELTNLLTNTVCAIDFLEMIDGVLTPLGLQYGFLTVKAPYNVTPLPLTSSDTHYQLKYDINDPDRAIRTIYLMIDNQAYLINDQSIINVRHDALQLRDVKLIVEYQRIPKSNLIKFEVTSLNEMFVTDLALVLGVARGDSYYALSKLFE